MRSFTSEIEINLGVTVGGNKTKYQMKEWLSLSHDKINQSPLSLSCYIN